MITKSYSRLSSILGDKSFSEILRGSSWALGLKVAALIFGFMSTLIISKYFGPRTVGLFNLSFTILSIITLFSLMGFPTAILRFAGEFKEDYAQQTIVKKMLILSISVSLFLAVVYYLSADYISVNLFHDQGLKKYINIMLIGTPVGIVSSILIEYIRGLCQIKASEIIRNSIFVFNLIIILFLVFVTNYNDLTPAIANVGAAILTFLIALIYFLNRLKQQRFKKATPVSYKQILSISSPMLLTASMFTTMGLSDRLMLGFFKTPYDVGIYTVALKLATITSMVLVAINTIVAPKFSELYWSHNLEELKKIVRFTSKIIFICSAPILVAYLLFSHQILSYFGKEFVQGSAALIILSAGQFINAASGSVGYFMDMTGHQNSFRNIIFTSSVINIVLNYLLIPKYGYNGAAVATAFSMAFWNIAALAYVKIKVNLFIGYIPFLNLNKIESK